MSGLQNIIEEWTSWARGQMMSSKPRDVHFELPERMALTLIGVRRCGKTHEAIRLAHTLAKNSFLYINFEDPFFVTNSSWQILDEIVEQYSLLTKKYPQIIVFDEIQNIDGWEKWVRKFIDLNKAKLILTGSSAKMLSSEIATSVTGRAIQKEIWPLSFHEFLLFKNYSPDEKKQIYLQEYLNWGGFPEINLALNDTEKSEILRQYFSDILYKDVVARNQIRSVRNLEQILVHYISNISSQHSFNSIKKAYNIPLDTVASYTKFLQDAFLIFEVNRFHKNLKIQSRDSKKIYSIDMGLAQKNSSSLSEDRGKFLENAIYLELKRRGLKVFYFREKNEVDFIVVDQNKTRNKPVAAIQVTDSNLETETLKKREIGGLIEALNFLNLPQGLILTRSRKEVLNIENKKISLLPAHDWLLDQVMLSAN